MVACSFRQLCRQGDVQAIGHNDSVWHVGVTPRSRTGTGWDHPVAPLPAHHDRVMAAAQSHYRTRAAGLYPRFTCAVGDTTSKLWPI